MKKKEVLFLLSSCFYVPKTANLNPQELTALFPTVCAIYEDIPHEWSFQSHDNDSWSKQLPC